MPKISKLLIASVLALVAATTMVVWLSSANIRLRKEIVLRDNLQSLRIALHQFKTDCGDYPVTLDQLTLPAETPPKGKGGMGHEIQSAKYTGPYLIDGVPRDPVWDGMLTPREILDGVDPRTGWMYDGFVGDVRSSSNALNFRGVPYHFL